MFSYNAGMINRFPIRTKLAEQTAGLRLLIFSKLWTGREMPGVQESVNRAAGAAPQECEARRSERLREPTEGSGRLEPVNERREMGRISTVDKRSEWGSMTRHAQLLGRNVGLHCIH